MMIVTFEISRKLVGKKRQSNVRIKIPKSKKKR